ncbi:MAG: protein translocase subunit SecF [Patescibacteria group bacterium]|mgnify:CR=1 FL=1
MSKLYKVMFSISLVLMAVCLGLFLIYGLNLGIDFTGGTLLELRTQNIEFRIIKESLEKSGVSNSTVSQTEDGFLIKMSEISEETHQQILSEFRNFGEVEEIRFDSIGSVLGSELKRKSIIAIVIALILISLYLAVVFSKVGGIISPWVLALGAIVALIHDLLLPIGVFSWLGQFKGVAIDAPLIAAALAILGYSINDTVVVYDRIRENILKNPSGNFNEVVHKSIKQTLVRSINTTLTTLFAVIAIYIFGGPTLKNFSLALIIGIASGAYSSIFLASPILMLFHHAKRDNRGA